MITEGVFPFLRSYIIYNSISNIPLQVTPSCCLTTSQNDCHSPHSLRIPLAISPSMMAVHSGLKIHTASRKWPLLWRDIDLWNMGKFWDLKWSATYASTKIASSTRNNRMEPSRDIANSRTGMWNGTTQPLEGTYSWSPTAEIRVYSFSRTVVSGMKKKKKLSKLPLEPTTVRNITNFNSSAKALFPSYLFPLSRCTRPKTGTMARSTQLRRSTK